ncbi:VC0807 family protein [Sphaerisporangium flaviroseum]
MNDRTPARRRRYGLMLLIDLAIPIGLYYLLRAAGLSYQASLVISSLVPGLSATTDLARGRRPDGLAVFMTVMMLLSFAVSLISGSARFMLAKDGWLTVVTGVWMLASARTDQPLTFPFARLLLERRVGPGKQSWDVLWRRAPGFRRIWRVCTVLWGIGLVLDAVVRVVMAYTLPVDVVPGLNAAQYVVFLLLMQVVTNLYLVPAGLYNPRSRVYEFDPEVPVPDSHPVR